jgi:hypothetical protein
VNECAAQIIPSLILLFDGLKRAYAGQLYSCIHVRVLQYLKTVYSLQCILLYVVAKAQEGEEEEEEEEDESDIDQGMY